MKKMMYFAAALLVLVGCQKKDNSIENTPKEVVTIKGSIELPQTPHKIAAPTDWESETEDFYMLWEADDKIYIYNTTECQQFTIASGAGDNEASFNGSPLSDMDSYSVAYGYNPQSTSTDYTVPYIEGNYRPFAEGLGTTDGFSIDNFGPVIGLQLKGEDVTLSKIEIILYGGYDNILGTFTMPFEGGLALNNTTATKVYFPLKNEPAEKMKIRFYEVISSVETLIMSKTVSGTKMPEANMVNKYPELVVVPVVPTYVDLGLPSGTKWASMNVGATCEEEYGLYFAWGGVNGYEQSEGLGNFTWAKAPTNGGNSEKNGDAIYAFIAMACVDNVLKPQYDAAYQNWGPHWRMPTEAEITELKDAKNTYVTFTTDEVNGIKGARVTSIADPTKSIFLPSAGKFTDTDFKSESSDGCYQSSSANPENWTRARMMSIQTTQYGCYFYSSTGEINLGFTVRPVHVE